MLEDFFNPNNWPLSLPHEFRIYADDNADRYAVVDEVDYHFLIQWKWRPMVSRGDKKIYLRRNFETQIESPYPGGGTYVNPETGREVRHRKPRLQQSLIMHVVIMWRTGIVPIEGDNIVVDHIDGDSWNCRRENLQWLTQSENIKKIRRAA